MVRCGFGRYLGCFRTVGVSVFLLAATLLAAAGGFSATWPTPELTAFRVVDEPGLNAWVGRTRLGETDVYLGLAVVCESAGLAGARVTVYFGSFPESRQVVQLAVRDAAGKVERFGPVIRAGPESGFHSPELKDADEAARFLGMALRPGSLVSNGYRSFWNRVDEAANEEVLAAFLACTKASR